MSSMGVRIEEFDVPVCNSFKAKVLNDQLCYEVDVNQFFSKESIEKGLKVGLVFLLDYNEDRYVHEQDMYGNNNSRNYLNKLGKI